MSPPSSDSGVRQLAKLKRSINVLIGDLERISKKGASALQNAADKPLFMGMFTTVDTTLQRLREEWDKAIDVTEVYSIDPPFPTQADDALLTTALNHYDLCQSYHLQLMPQPQAQLLDVSMNSSSMLQPAPKARTILPKIQIKRFSGKMERRKLEEWNESEMGAIILDSEDEDVEDFVEFEEGEDFESDYEILFEDFFIDDEELLVRVCCVLPPTFTYPLTVFNPHFLSSFLCSSGAAGPPFFVDSCFCHITKMRNGIAVVCLCAVAVMVGAHPLDNNHERIARQANTNEVTSSNPLSREKRTIGILRDLFPNFSRIIDNKIQQLTRIIFRIVGRLVLNGGGGGGGGGGNSDDDERRISITLPTYPPDELEDEDEDEESTDSASEATSDSESTASTTTTTASPSGDENDVAESKKNEVRIKREAPAAPAVAPAADAAGANASEEGETVEEEDLDSEATGDNEVAGAGDAESSEVEEEEEEEANPEDPRNKRFLNFNLGATASENGGGGSAGGSGNFLFDIIRRSADRAARMAGTVYRVLAGTDDAGLPTYDATENAARSVRNKTQK
ncbi:hypothetical protein GE061_006705 [Apolygus lucorum]|uniref:Uncharacterized protein n=1 Tax=Apolygus lucorum TaxID=248454 RepID=A0A8S9WUJ9_APOLU|nr:hypothetical protein GE061_006705 [Apolygus lucorum]